MGVVGSQVHAARPAVELRIKWPNDVYTADGLKVGGILCQSTYMSGHFDVTIGIGLNVSNSAPTTCLNDLLPPGQQQPRFTREHVLADFLSTFERYFEQFREEGFRPFLSQYLAAWLHSEQAVSLKRSPEEPTPKQVVVQTISLDTGFLVARDAADPGVSYELHPDGHSMDWMAGLLVYKVIA